MNEEDRILKAALCETSVKVQLQSPKDLIMKRDVAVAREQARWIIEAARQEAGQIREQARREGIDLGLRDVARIIGQAEQHRIEILRRSQEEMLPLALAVARKVIGTAIELDRDLMSRLIEQALKQVSTARRLLIRISPQGMAALSAAQQRFLSPPGAIHFDLVSDESLSPGDCIIETEIGRIDARIDTQLDHILASLLSLEET